MIKLISCQENIRSILLGYPLGYLARRENRLSTAPKQEEASQNCMASQAPVFVEHTWILYKIQNKREFWCL